MLNTSRQTLTAIATVAALAAGGAALAGAATSTNPSSSSSSSSSSSTERSQRPANRALTGETADKVTAAARAKVPGGTVLRVEEGGPYSARYHAHVRKSGGTEVVVLVNASFEATSVETRPAGGPRGRGPGGPGGKRHEALTGETAAKVKAAALAKVPGGTVLRTKKGGPGGAAYHAHVRKSDGTEVVVLVNASFEATSVEEHHKRP